MTLDDFQTRIKSYRLCEVASFGFLMVGLVFCAFVCSFLEDRANRAGFDTGCIIFTLVSSPLVTLFIVYGVSRFPSKRLRQLGLLCPTCHKALVGTRGAKKKLHIVLTTGKCGFCGEQVLDSEP